MIKLAAVLGAAVLSVAACSSGSGTVTQASSPPVSPAQPSLAATAGTEGGYNATVEDTFMTSCTPALTGEGISQQAAEAYCGCAYTELESTVPFDEFEAATSDPSSKAMTAIQTKCGPELTKG